MILHQMSSRFLNVSVTVEIALRIRKVTLNEIPSAARVL